MKIITKNNTEQDIDIYTIELIEEAFGENKGKITYKKIQDNTYDLKSYCIEFPLEITKSSELSEFLIKEIAKQTDNEFIIIGFNKTIILPGSEEYEIKGWD